MDDARRYAQTGQNRLLASLPERDAQQITANAQRLSLSLKDVLLEPNEPITHVHFPLSGVMSLVLDTQEGSVEVATIGNEGMVGTPLLLGSDRSPTRGFCQVPGDVLRVSAEDFKAALLRSSALHDLLHRYTQALINQISQSVACNHMHPIEQRMCRWLCMTHDRVGIDEFSLTQEFLSQMLGVRRPSVTVVAGMLQKAGLIAYNRGRISVIDREALEAGACECYRTVRDEFDRLFARDPLSARPRADLPR